VKLEGKRILLTGGGSGIGRACALALAAVGRPVAVWDRDADAATVVAKDIGDAAYAIGVDVTSETEARAALTELGDLDLLVNNAGLLRAYPLSSADAEAWSVEDVQVNVIGALRMSLWGAKIRCTSLETEDLQAGREFWHPTRDRGTRRPCHRSSQSSRQREATPILAPFTPPLHPHAPTPTGRSLLPAGAHQPASCLSGG
jgi:hypothetical protein